MATERIQSGHANRLWTSPCRLPRPGRCRFGRAWIAGWFSLALLAVLLLPTGALAFGLRPHGAVHAEQHEVILVDDQMRQALLTADIGTLDRVLADDFLGIAANGTLSDKQQYISRIGKREHQFSRIDIKDRKVRLRGSSAVLVTTAKVVGKLDSSSLNGTFRYIRVYSREPDGSWKLRNFEATRVSGAGSDEMNHGEPITKARQR